MLIYVVKLCGQALMLLAAAFAGFFLAALLVLAIHAAIARVAWQELRA